MTYEQWERVKEECHNAKKVSFAGLSKEAQEAMREACEIMGASVDWLDCDDSWKTVHEPMFYKNKTYRINPSWPGPPKPDPVAEYEDLPVIKDDHLYYFTINGICRYLTVARTFSRFAGYVMPDGRIRPRLIFDQQKDGTYRLRVPKAVRLVKEVAK